MIILVIRLKICLLGEMGVGKTSMILKYVNNTFQNEYKATLAADFIQKKMSPNEFSELTQPVDLIIWDLAGQRNYLVDKMTEYYLQGSNGYILVYDLTSLSSIKNLENWHKRIQENCGDIPFIVVGNKCDLIDQIEVDDNKLKPFLKKYKTNFYKTSARTGENLNKPFLELTKKILESCIEEK